MTTLLELTFASIMAVVTPTGPADAARLASAAGAVSEATTSAPLWPGTAGSAATATLLVAIAFHESGFREDVQRCRVRGDRGRSLGLFQLMRDAAWSTDEPAAICDSDALQARLAVAALGRFRRRCPACTARQWINGYASGDIRRATRAADQIVALWVAISSRRGLVVRPERRDTPSWSAPGSGAASAQES